MIAKVISLRNIDRLLQSYDQTNQSFPIEGFHAITPQKADDILKVFGIKWKYPEDEHSSWFERGD